MGGMAKTLACTMRFEFILLELDVTKRLNSGENHENPKSRPRSGQGFILCQHNSLVFMV